MMILDFLFVPHYTFFSYKSIQRYCIYVSICIYLWGVVIQHYFIVVIL